MHQLSVQRSLVRGQRREKRAKSDFKRTCVLYVCVQSEKKNENMMGFKKNTQTLLTLFLRVKFTSSVSFSKISASFKHLDASEEKYTQPGQMIFFSIVSIQESWFEFREISVYPMLGSRECCSWKLSSANKAAWICSGAWWVNLENIAGKQFS